MEQQVNATVRITYSANAELEREELERRAIADVRRLFNGTAEPNQFEAMRVEILELVEEAAIYGNDELTK
jgi:antitoxin component HigA of HigAB toxin-antitoxin module